MYATNLTISTQPADGDVVEPPRQEVERYKPIFSLGGSGQVLNIAARTLQNPVIIIATIAII